MDTLDDRFDKLCWRISTKLTQSHGAARTTASGVVEYFDMHTKLCNVAKFHRDFVAMQGGDEEVVYRALCYIEQAVLTPYSGTNHDADWLHYSLQILLGVAHPYRQIGPDAKKFLDDMRRGIDSASEITEDGS